MRNSSAKCLAIVGAIAILVSGCTVVTVASVDDSELAASTTAELLGAEADGQLLETGLPFVNTGSVLFPNHKMTQVELAAQMERYTNSFEDFLPTDLYVSRSEYVRSGPGTFYSPLRFVASWEKLLVDGKSGSWYRLADRSGYFPANHLVDLLHPTAIVWDLKVLNSGGEEEIDECLGGLTNYLPMAEDLGVPVWSMHGNCGGETAFDLKVDDIVTVDGNKYQVLSHSLFPLFSSTESLRGLTGQDAFIQVCDLVEGYSHIIGLKGI